MWIIKQRKFFVGLSIFLVIVSAVVLAKFGLNQGIEFAGGTVIEVSYQDGDRPAVADLNQSFADAGFEEFLIQHFGDNNVVVRMQELAEDDRPVVMSALEPVNATEVVIERWNTVGPTLGKSLARKAFWALGLVIIAILAFVAYAFRRAGDEVSSWKYGLVTVLALLHDVMIPVGVFAVLGKDVTSLFVVGLLSILGLSVNDTIVVFDRIRENLALNREHKNKKGFKEIVGDSLQQTMARSINTSLTLIVVLIALHFFGPASTQDLVLVLIVGMAVGTYSSIFFASPLLTFLATPTNKKK